MRKTVAALEAQVKTLNGVNLSALRSDLKSIANPKFNWDPALKQVDDFTKKIQKGKLSISEYWQAHKNGVDQIVQQQARLSRAVATPIGTKGAMAMTIPSAKDIEPTITASERLNRTLAVQSQLMSGLGTKVQDWGKNTQWAGRQMTVGLTMPLAMAAVAAGRYALDIDKSMVHIEKVYDGSTKGLRDMAMKNAMELTHSLGTSVKSSLDVMAELAAAGKQGQEMFDLTKQAQTMATLGNIDQAESIKAVISMQSIYNMSTKDVANSVSYLNAVEAATPTNLQDLVDSIPIAGATVKQLGGDLKDTTVLLTAFKERGISTVEGANAIKSAMNRILVPTKQAKNLFKEFTGKDLNALVDQTNGKPLETMQALSDAIMGSNIALEDQQRIISKLFGTYQSTRITALLTSLQDKDGAVAKTKALSAQSDEELNAIREKHEAAIRNSASGQFKIAVESFKAQMQSFGEIALKVATFIINKFSKVLEIFNGLPEPVKQLAMIFGGVIAIAGPLTMLIGLIANLMGGVTKFAGWLMGLKNGFKAMTIEEKAAKLSAEGMSAKMLSQADAAQILIFQMEKLVGAINGVSAAQQKAMATGSMYSGIKSLSGQQVIAHPITGELRTPNGAPLSDTDKAYVQQQLLNREKKATVDLEEKVAEKTEKSSKMAKAFSSESLLAISAVSGIASMTAETGSSLEKWLTWISLASVALSALQPILAKIGTTIASTNIAQSIASGASGMASKVGGSIKTALSSALSFMKSPVGLGIGAGLLAAYGVFKLLGSSAEKQRANHEAILKSTDMWTAALGSNKLVWGQIKQTSGQVKDTIDSMAEKLKEQSKPLVDRFRAVTDMNELKWMSNVEVGNLQGQGKNKSEINTAMEALLRAAGKTKQQIDEILGNINVSFDFKNGEQDIQGFLSTMRKKIVALNSNLLDKKAVFYPGNGLDPTISDSALHNLEQQTAEIKTNFMDRLAGLNETERAVFSKRFIDDMAKTYFSAFDQFNQQYGGQLGKDWGEARKKFMEFDTGSGEWVLNQAGKTQIPRDAGVKLKALAKEESDLTKAIAEQRGVNKDRIKGMSVLGDLMPWLGGNIGNATKVQEDFNSTVKKAADAGYTMTDAEKKKLAEVWAGVAGLDAGKLATNGYAAANVNSAEAAQKNYDGIKNLISALKDASTASEDFWSSVASGSEGFQALGGTAQEQAQRLTDKVKGIYSGAMDSVYQAYSSSANEQWARRLQSITDAFDKQKETVQKQLDASDKAYEKKQQEFQDNWDARIDAVKQGYEDQEKAIRDQQEAEQELEQQRQKQFDAEKQRIERMAELANRNIDYNRALYGGNLDEAARIQNNTGAVISGWKTEDAKAGSADKAAAKDKEFQAKLDSLKEEEDAVIKSLEAQREAEKRSMEESRNIEKERLQAKLDSLSKEQQAAEETERRKQEIQKQTLDIQLATLKAFIPQNEEQLNEHINRVGTAYGEFGLGLQGAGSIWGQIVGNALQNNVDIARQQMSSDANWAAFGASVANSISQGAFGLNLKDFMNLLVTGKPPPGWAPPSVLGTTGTDLSSPQGGMTHWARHAGGPVDDSLGSRNARGNSSLGSDEVSGILQKGEFVINKAAVQRIGTQNLERINAGNPEMPTNSSVGLAGIPGMIAGAMANVMTQIAVNRMAQFYASQNMEVAQALGLGGAGISAAIDFAKAQDGKPYIWTGVGPQGYDCSGYMSAIANVLTGKDPHQRVFSTGMMTPGKALGPFEPGLGGPFEIGVKHGNPGHTAGTLMGVNVESTGDHVRYGKDAHGATDKQFTMQFHVPFEKVVNQSGGMVGGGGTEGLSGVKGIVNVVASKYGWGQGAEWAALDWLVQHESSWNPTAQNPNSTAYGLFQFLNSTWGAYGSTKTSDPRLQAEAGMKYIKARYTDPLGAKRFWETHHWYDGGGDLLPGAHNIYNGTNMTESILTNRMTRGVIGALQNATVSYLEFKNILRGAVRVSPSEGSYSGNTSHVHNNNIIINGTQLSPKELEMAIKNGIQAQEKLNLKKSGRIK